jgi:hypothetical protein
MDNEIDITSNSFAELSFGGNQMATVTGLAGSYKKVAVGSPAFQMQMFGFAFSDNKLIYQGANRTFKTSLLALVTHNGEALEREIRITVYRNANPVSEAFGKVSSAGNSIYKAASFSGSIDLVNGDALEVMVCNASGTEAIIVKDLKFTLASS